MGAMAVEMLLERIEDRDRPSTKRVLPVNLVIRDSA